MKRDEQQTGAKTKVDLNSAGPSQSSRPKLQGHKLVTSWSTIAAQSNRSRLVLALLRDGQDLQFKVQEMRPRFFEVGLNRRECLVYMDEHGRLMGTVRRLKQTPLERWMEEYRHIRLTREPEISADRKLVYLCMAENLQVCWRSLLAQLEDRWRLLCASCEFYDSLERLARSLDEAEARVQLIGEGSAARVGGNQLAELLGELKSIGQRTSKELDEARGRQIDLTTLIGYHASDNLGDSRANLLAAEASALIDYLTRCLELVERRKLQLDTQLSGCLNSFSRSNPKDGHQQSPSIEISRLTTKKSQQTKTIATSDLATNESDNSIKSKQVSSIEQQDQFKVVSKVREINNFNDLNLADNWLSSKIEQLNSVPLCSLGLSIADSRAILNKHEQIALECRAIEEATLMFAGKSIHALKAQQVEPVEAGTKMADLFEQQRRLADKTRDVITILGARLVLLRRTIDFYLRAKEASEDVGRLTRRLQLDSSLQSVQFVASELELRDVSSVVASGATIISELQQLQLAQQQGQRSSLVSLSLTTSGIRLLIDQLNQELVQLKSLLSQRRLILMNEDATKIADNIMHKCSQLHSWLKLNVKGHLLADNSVPLELDEARKFCERHQQLRLELQGNTLELEALLRLLPTLTENLDARGEHMTKIHEAVDELRREWIETNCLDARLEFANRYVQLLRSLQLLSRELQSLYRFSSGQQTNPERTDEDINLSIEQTLARVTNELHKFELDANKPDTQLLDSQRQPNDLNKSQLIDHVKQQLAQFEADRRRLAEGRVARLSESRNQEQAASQRKQQHLPPRFTRPLADQQVEPFSHVELECETDTADCQLDWFMGNFRRIPSTIKHQATSDGHTHRLTIQQFGPICCGTYLARASNSAGQVTSQCRLKLLGIREDQDNEQQAEPGQQKAQVQSPAESKESAEVEVEQETSRLQATDQSARSECSSRQEVSETETSIERMSRLIQGVEQREPSEPKGESPQDIRLPVTRFSYFGPGSQLEVPTSRYTVESPLSSASLPNSRSVSKSPSVIGTPQAPVFVQGLRDTLVRCSSRAGLVCLVVGNPPPTIEWLHNNQSIATAKCQAAGPAAKANICKLTIETMNQQTQGQYVCRAFNRMGQSSTNILVSKRPPDTSQV